MTRSYASPIAGRRKKLRTGVIAGYAPEIPGPFRRRSMSLRTPMLLLGCLLGLYGEAAAEDATDREKLEGAWSFVSSSGGNQNKGQDAGMRVVFKGETISFVPKDDKRTLRGSYSVDPSKSPKAMEI